MTKLTKYGLFNLINYYYIIFLL